MPRLDEQFCVLAVADLTPARGEDLLNLVGPKEYIGGVAGNAIHRRAKSIGRTEGIYDVIGRGIHVNRLGERMSWEHNDGEQKQ